MQGDLLERIKSEVEQWRSNRRNSREHVPEHIINLVRQASESHSAFHIQQMTSLARSSIDRALAGSRLKGTKKTLSQESSKPVELSFSEVSFGSQSTPNNQSPPCTVTVSNPNGRTLRIENFFGAEELLRAVLMESESCFK
jgi:hypothetical protein